jgi:transcriptional regulator with XRE-family HTH domain
VKKCGDFLKMSREAQGLSQRDVSTAMGYNTSQFISNWERGLSLPPIPTLRKLAKVYRVDADTLFNVILEAQVEMVTASLTEKFEAEKIKRPRAVANSSRIRSARA